MPGRSHDADNDSSQFAAEHLTPLWFLILVVLSDGPLHGYRLLQELERRTRGRFSPGTGTLYTALQRLTDDGLIQEEPSPPGADRRRRYYGLTTRGRTAARAEAGRMAEMVALAVEAEFMTPIEAGRNAAR